MTKALTAAQQLRLSFFGEVKRYSYKPPHALQPTPARPMRPRKHWDAMKFSAYLVSRPPVFGGRV